MVYYSQLFNKSFPHFVESAQNGSQMTCFGIVNKAEIDVFLELSCFFDDPAVAGNLISSSSGFSKSRLNIWEFGSRIAEPWLGEF